MPEVSMEPWHHSTQSLHDFLRSLDRDTLQKQYTSYRAWVLASGGDDEDEVMPLGLDVSP